MRLSAIVFFASLVALQAEPVIVGYERFHGEEPTIEGGAILYSELGCANCHGSSPIDLPRRGPLLDGIGKRVREQWLIDYLSDPQATKPGTTMPSLFQGEDRVEKVEAVVAYLMRTKEPKLPKMRKARHANAERGSELYHKKGCVSCHAPTSDFHPAGGAVDVSKGDYPAKGFPDLQEKYSVESLYTTIRAMKLFRQDGRMPHLELTDVDATDIAAHLMDFQDSNPQTAATLDGPLKAEKDRIERGRELVEAMNCATCHEVGGIESPAVVPISSGKVSCKVASYGLTDKQSQSLELFLGKSEDATLEKTDLSLTALNCYACHERGGKGGPDEARDRYFVGDEGIGDSGRLAPPLDGIGRKLQQSWMKGVLKGEHRVRDYVETQMPHYEMHVDTLTKMFAEEDAKSEEPLAKGGDIHAGQKLLGIEGGVNCITCHQWGDRPSLGIQALDLSNLDQRLRPEWYREYLLNPASYRPGTLMPTLWPGGQSTVPDVLEGDTEKQIASIWAFIKDGEGVPSGYPETATGAFELKPTDRPIIQRTFSNEAGTHAIMVGYPEGIHIAYDAKLGRPAAVWRGRFFDAYSTWYVRAAPFESPLEEEVSLWSEVPTVEGAEFGGYRLDEKGYPTFLLKKDGVEYSEKFVPTKDGKLRRVVSPPSNGISHPVGLAVEIDESGSEDSTIYLYSWK